jgi:3-dehydroquinate synthase
MRAATILAEKTGRLGTSEAASINNVIAKYGPIPGLDGIEPTHLAARLRSDKKTIQGQVHFVLPVKIGDVAIVSGVEDRLVLESIQAAL